MRGTRLPAMILAAAAMSAAFAGLGRAQSLIPQVPRRCASHPAEPLGPKILVQGVTFSGPSNPPGLTRDQMVDLIRSNAASASNPVHEPIWQVVRDAWQAEGYLRAVISADAKVIASGSGWKKLAYHVRTDPGPQYRVGLIRIESAVPHGKLAFSVLRLRGLVTLGGGQVFDRDRLIQGIRSIEAVYAREGYIDATVTPEVALNNQKDTANLSLVIDQGKQFRIDQVQAPGLDPSLEPMLHAKLKKGSVFDPDVIREFYRDEATALVRGASPADVQVRRNEKAGSVDLLLDFRACPQNASRTGAGGSAGPELPLD